MKPGEYKTLQLQAMSVAAIVAALPDLTPMLRAIDHAHTVGPIVDPTLWMHAHRSMGHIRAIGSALETAKRAIEEHRVALIVELARRDWPDDVAVVQALDA